MNKETLDYIQHLSKQDTKNLSAKGFKTAEELGELAKAILPYEGAFATTHRFVLKEAILEEVSDVILCALSIAYDLGYSHEDIENMLIKKSKKWAGLQAEAQSASYPLPFEIHITVAPETNIEEFKKLCATLNVKATILNLQDLDGNTIINDIMTSSIHYGDNKSVLEEINRIYNGLLEAKIKIVRRKIETVPWHPAVPTLNNKREMPKDCYFETHLELDASKYKTKIDAFWKALIYQNEGLAFSVNEKRKDTIIGLTLRDYKGTKEWHLQRVKDLKGWLVSDSIVEEMTEFSIFDTSILHDQIWMHAGV